MFGLAHINRNYQKTRLLNIFFTFLGILGIIFQSDGTYLLLWFAVAIH
ncbi:MAG: hypothetical protein JSW35_03045 [Deltaproteobacteria bacterium]|nr:MAG: hypothetical protein JSW35_03045 [Deltaproteobacteria bacterium]